MDVDPAPPAAPEPQVAKANEDEDAKPPVAEGGGEGSGEPSGAPKEGGEDDEVREGGEEGVPAPPTTRSKTAPLRRPSTPEPSPPPAIRRGVMTLSDVHAARAVLAEKANQHWMKGLGGGQNREGETIVNFLYKNKVGHGEYGVVG